jgi:hypothetical protein
MTTAVRVADVSLDEAGRTLPDMTTVAVGRTLDEAITVERDRYIHDCRIAATTTGATHDAALHLAHIHRLALQRLHHAEPAAVELDLPMACDHVVTVDEARMVAARIWDGVYRVRRFALDGDVWIVKLHGPNGPTHYLSRGVPICHNCAGHTVREDGA